MCSWLPDKIEWAGFVHSLGGCRSRYLLHVHLFKTLSFQWCRQLLPETIEKVSLPMAGSELDDFGVSSKSNPSVIL